MNALLSFVEQTQIGAYVVGLVALLAWESFRPFFDQFHDATRRRGVHLFHNLLLGAVNSVVIALGFVGLWALAATWAEASGFGLMNWLDAALGLPAWVHALGAILLLDAWTYTWHRLNHVVPFFWRFHRVHHADAQMDVTTASRFHVGEIVLSSLLRIPLIALFGVYLWELLLYETLMFAVVQFHHANIGLPPKVDRALRFLIVTPAMHKVHHSRWQPETDSNYSALFSFWDRIGRSFRLRERLHEIDFGLDEFDAPETVKRLMVMPTAPLHKTERSEEGGATRGDS